MALLDKRAAVSRIIIVAVVVVIAVVAGIGGYFALNSPGTSPDSNLITLSIVETDSVNQVSSLIPANITVTHGTTVTLAVQNHDDAPRTLEISAFGVNQTIGTGQTERVTFTAGQPGTFQMVVPAKPAANGVKASPALTGYVIVA